jgi:hypothetical protein
MAGEVEAPREDVGQRGQLARGRYRLDVPDSPALERAQAREVERDVEHLLGPERVPYGRDELVVLVLVRNGRAYVESFVEHYLSLGAKHIVFLDNGSTDGTIETLKGYDDVTVLRTGLPYKQYNIAFKRYLIERFGRDRWTLSVDVDELFDYPFSDVVGIGALLGYLNENAYTAVVSHMLDMFPGRPLREDGPCAGEGGLKESYRFYDISDVRTRPYSDIGDVGNVLGNEEIELLWGGVHRRIFGCSPLLTKHPLVVLDGRLKPMDLSDHWVGNARVADFTGLLLHYKLVDGIYGQVRMEIAERRDLNLGGKYDKYSGVLQEVPNLLIKNAASKELGRVNDLVGTHLVTVSRRYMKLVDSLDGERPERLLDAFFDARAEASALREELGFTRRRKRVAEEHLRAITGSRSWKALAALGRLKARSRAALDRLRPGKSGSDAEKCER